MSVDKAKVSGTPELSTLRGVMPRGHSMAMIAEPSSSAGFIAVGFHLLEPTIESNQGVGGDCREFDSGDACNICLKCVSRATPAHGPFPGPDRRWEQELPHT
jgi:hypothetical protein